MSRGLATAALATIATLALHTTTTASSRDSSSNNKDDADVEVVTLGALQPPLVDQSRHSSSSGRPGKASLAKAESPDEAFLQLLQHTFGSVLEAQQHDEALEAAAAAAAGELSNTLAPEEQPLGATSTKGCSESGMSALLEGFQESGLADMTDGERTIPTTVGQVDKPCVDGVVDLIDSFFGDSKREDTKKEAEHEVVLEAATSPGSGDGAVIGEKGGGDGEAATTVSANTNIEVGAATRVGGKTSLGGFESSSDSSGIDPHSALSADGEAVSLRSAELPEMGELGGAIGTASAKEDTSERPDDPTDEDEAAGTDPDDPGGVVSSNGHPRGNDAPPFSDEGEMDNASGDETNVTGTGIDLPSSVGRSPGVDGEAMGEGQGPRDEPYSPVERRDGDKGKNMAETLAEGPTVSAALEGRGTGGWVDELEAPAAGGVPLGGDETRRDTTSRAQQEEQLPAEKAVRSAFVEEPLTRDAHDDVARAGDAFGTASRNAAAEDLELREQPESVIPGVVSTSATAVADEGLESASIRPSTDVRPPQERYQRDDAGGDVVDATTNGAVPLAAGDYSTVREQDPRSEERVPRKRPAFFFSEPAKTNGGGTVGDAGASPGGAKPRLSPDNVTGFTMPPLPPIGLNNPTSTQGPDLGGNSQGDVSSSSERDGWWDTWGSALASVTKETGLRWARIAGARGVALADAGLQLCRARAVKTWHEILEPRVERLRQRLEACARAAYDEVGEYVADPMLAEGL